MDFFTNQPHPETNETACVHLKPGAAPLAPAVTERAVTCAGAYAFGAYRLLLVPADAPQTVVRYSGATIDSLAPEGAPIALDAPVRAVSWLLRADAPLLCLHADRVYFYTVQGERVADIALDAASATAYTDGKTCCLVADGAVLTLTDALALADAMPMPVRAMPCLIPNRRVDVLQKTGRVNPGTVGGMLFSHRGRVHYVCADVFARCAMDNLDTFICEVYDLKNPYSRRYLAIPNGGAASLFVGPDDRVYAAFVGATPTSAVYGQAAIIPMDYVEDAFYRPDGAAQYETLPSTRLTPRGGIDKIRDTFICNAPDGYYYLTGSTPREGGTYWSHTNGVQVWRTSDLEHFEPLGKVFDYYDTPTSWQHQVSPGLNTWAPEIIYHNDTFWITYSTAPGCGLLKSVTGKPEGPYADMGRMVVKGIDSGFFAEDGVLYLIWQNGRIAPLTENGASFREEPVLLLPTDGQQVGYEGAGVIKVNGKYVLYAAEWNGDARIDGTYDMMYSVADSLMGPYCPRRVLVPHGGHGCLFFDKEGQLHYTIFGNDRTAPFRHSVGIGTLDIAEQDGLLTLTPV